MSTSAATAYKYSVVGHLSFGAPKCEKAQKSSGFWANRTYRLCIKDNVLIDMGCGTGDATIYLKKRGINACGIDLSDGMLKMALKNSNDIFWIKGDITNCPFPDKSFYGIVLSYTINHLNLDMIELAIKEVNRLLENDGYLLVAYHVGEGEEYITEPLNPTLKIYYHYYTNELLKKLLLDYELISYHQRSSLGVDELLNDKAFAVYRRVVR